MHTCNVRGFFLSVTNATADKPRNIAPHRNLSGLPLILLTVFLFLIRHASLCDAHSAEILSACNRCIFLTKGAEFHPAWFGRKLPLRQPDARMTRYFRSFSQFTHQMERQYLPEPLNHAEKAMPSSGQAPIAACVVMTTFRGYS
ncbi:hypothetical protein ACNKHW_22480 [Shigella flexneri]